MNTFARVLIAESRAETLKAVRLPAFIIPTVLFPAMFYALFALLLNRGGTAAGIGMPAYLLGSYGTFGVVGAALFGMGVAVAAERGQGWLALKRTTPMPPLAYFGAKLVMSAAIGLLIMLLLSTLGLAFGHVRMPPLTWLLLFGILSLGTIPFCAFGCALGYVTGPTSAPAVANLIYLPMSLLSGLWIPLEFMPRALQSLAPAMPPYHLARLAHETIAGTPTHALPNLFALAGFTVLFLMLARIGYRRDDDRTWG